MKISNRMIIAVIILIALAFVSESLKISEDYEEVLISNPWDHSPVTVYIDDRNTPEHYSPSYRGDVEKALDYWENGGNGKLAYEADFEVIDNDSADIVISWVNNLEEDAGANDNVAGYARPLVLNGKYEYVLIVLETGNYEGYSWSQYGDRAMEYIARHELGHALGLGHSNDKNDIMYPNYDRRENLNPLLLQSTWPILLILLILAAIVVSYHSTGWMRLKKKRKELEEDVFKEDENE